MTDSWLTVREVADLLKISPRQIQRLVKPSAGRDRIPALQVGSVVRIRQAALAQWIARREGQKT